MAQKREKEETELKVPETLTLCTTQISNPQPKLSGTEDSASSSARLDTKLSGAVDLRSRSAKSPERSDLSQLSRSEDLKVDGEVWLKKPVGNRCSGCRRKVGLTGFRCRCGELFCSEHRYSDRHDCSFDYKGVGREAIARENPVIRPAKILKV
ncbi:unnamed protein product [Ilex paraguariensis]|uniref:AN1-type domain-containing protein n=1 Tax=Ilex paraguariensis TaxID=185542 RepID=A0ABC8RP11_9AQUA